MSTTLRIISARCGPSGCAVNGDVIVTTTAPSKVTPTPSSTKSSREPPKPCMKITPARSRPLRRGSITSAGTRPPGAAYETVAARTCAVCNRSWTRTSSGASRSYSNRRARRGGSGFDFRAPASPLPPQPASTTAATSAALDQHRERIPLRLEDRLLDVAQVLAVDLQRQRPVALDRDAVDVGPSVHERVVAEAAARRARQEPREDRGADGRRRDVAEAAFEPHAADEPQRQRTRIRVRRAVRDEQERRAADVLDLQHRVEPETRLREQSDHRAREGEVARALPRVGPPARVDPTHHLRVEADTRREREAPAVDPAERDPPRPARAERPRDRTSGIDQIG